VCGQLNLAQVPRKKYKKMKLKRTNANAGSSVISIQVQDP